MKHEDGLEIRFDDMEGNAYGDRAGNCLSFSGSAGISKFQTITVCIPLGTRLGIRFRMLENFKHYNTDAVKVTVKVLALDPKREQRSRTIIVPKKRSPSSKNDVLQQVWIDRWQDLERLEMPQPESGVSIAKQQSCLVVEVERIDKIQKAGSAMQLVGRRGRQGDAKKYHFYVNNRAYPNGCAGCTHCRRKPQVSVPDTTAKPGLGKDSGVVAAPGQSAGPKSDTQTNVSQGAGDMTRRSILPNAADTVPNPSKVEFAKHGSNKLGHSAIGPDEPQEASQPAMKKRKVAASINNISPTKHGKNALADATNGTHIRGYVDDDRDDEEISPPALKAEPMIKDEISPERSHPPTSATHLVVKSQPSAGIAVAATPDKNSSVQQVRNARVAVPETNDEVRRLSTKVQGLEQQMEKVERRIRELESTAFRSLTGQNENKEKR